MMRYQITNPRTGVELGTYEAESKQEALDMMAEDAGYSSYAAASDVTGEYDLSVEVVT